MTPDELAEKNFVTRQTESNYGTGKSRPDIEMLEKQRYGRVAFPAEEYPNNVKDARVLRASFACQRQFLFWL